MPLIIIILFAIFAITVKRYCAQYKKQLFGNNIEEVTIIDQLNYFDQVIFSPVNFTTTDKRMWRVIKASLQRYVKYINHSGKYTPDQMNEMLEYIPNQIVKAMTGSGEDYTYTGLNKINNPGALFFMQNQPDLKSFFVFPPRKELDRLGITREVITVDDITQAWQKSKFSEYIFNRSILSVMYVKSSTGTFVPAVPYTLYTEFIGGLSLHVNDKKDVKTV